MTYMTIREAAEKWDLTPRRVQQLCKSGEIEGAVKEGRSWLIREDISYQVKRLHTAPGEAGWKRPLPVGVSSYKEAVTSYYYVDKTLMIRDFLNRIPKVTLFTRPRRFGKTLNMDMLRVFFEKTEEDTSAFFKDQAIWACGEACRRHQGRYPVIFLSFKDVKFNDWQASYQKLAELMGAEYERHAEPVFRLLEGQRTPFLRVPHRHPPGSQRKHFQRHEQSGGGFGLKPPFRWLLRFYPGGDPGHGCLLSGGGKAGGDHGLV